MGKQVCPSERVFGIELGVEVDCDECSQERRYDGSNKSKGSANVSLFEGRVI